MQESTHEVHLRWEIVFDDTCTSLEFFIRKVLKKRWVKSTLKKVEDNIYHYFHNSGKGISKKELTKQLQSSAVSIQSLQPLLPKIEYKTTSISYDFDVKTLQNECPVQLKLFSFRHSEMQPFLLRPCGHYLSKRVSSISYLCHMACFYFSNQINFRWMCPLCRTPINNATEDLQYLRVLLENHSIPHESLILKSSQKAIYLQCTPNLSNLNSPMSSPEEALQTLKKIKQTQNLSCTQFTFIDHFISEMSSFYA